MVDFDSGDFRAGEIKSYTKQLKDLPGVFQDEEAYKDLDPTTLVYQVECLFPVEEGAQGGLFWGRTRIFPGQVGSEFFMTRGHFHARREQAEYYLTISGEGALLLMDDQRRCHMECMRRGALHYIPGGYAHRVANTGKVPLDFWACWPSNAGHDYGSIEKAGFSVRLLSRDGVPTLCKEEGR
jgi:glucose-6-phosphate isomerase, archaeal